MDSKLKTPALHAGIEFERSYCSAFQSTDVLVTQRSLRFSRRRKLSIKSQRWVPCRDAKTVGESGIAVSIWRQRNLILNPYHSHTHRPMVARLPFEIVDHIVGYLDVEDVRSIARVCSAFRLPAQIRLFSSIDIASSPSKAYPGRIESILSSPHLLQYSSRLLVQCIGSMQQNSIQSLWPHLPVMYRLRNMYIYLGPGDCSRALSALESLGSGREIALDFRRNLAPNLLISDNPLPIHTLELRVDTSNHQVATRLVQKCSQSLRRLRLILRDNTTPPLPFLPHLYEFFVYTHLHEKGKELDLMSLFPFLDQHPTITRLLLGNEFTLAVQPPPNLLPNLQFLGATPPIIDRLILGRPVNDIDAICPSQASRFPVDIMLQPLRQSFVPVTTLAIDADIYFPYDDLINILRALPKLRKFTLRWSWHEVRRLSEGRRYSKLIGTRFLSAWKAY